MHCSELEKKTLTTQPPLPGPCRMRDEACFKPPPFPRSWPPPKKNPPTQYFGPRTRFPFVPKKGKNVFGAFGAWFVQTPAGGGGGSSQTPTRPKPRHPTFPRGGPSVPFVCKMENFLPNGRVRSKTMRTEKRVTGGWAGLAWGMVSLGRGSSLAIVFRACMSSAHSISVKQIVN
jgi:hypothetical protein